MEQQDHQRILPEYIRLAGRAGYQPKRHLHHHGHYCHHQYDHLFADLSAGTHQNDWHFKICWRQRLDDSESLFISCHNDHVKRHWYWLDCRTRHLHTATTNWLHQTRRSELLCGHSASLDSLWRSIAGVYGHSTYLLSRLDHSNITDQKNAAS